MPPWARSKSVTEFLGQPFDYVITVCDQARQVCPVFPGVAANRCTGATRTRPRRPAPTTSGWPSSADVFTQLGERIHQFVPLALRHRAETSVATASA